MACLFYKETCPVCLLCSSPWFEPQILYMIFHQPESNIVVVVVKIFSLLEI